MQVGVAILMPDKTDFKQKLIRGERMTLHTDQRKNPLREHRNS